MNNFVRAWFETRFLFEAFAPTAQEATALLEKAWAQHRKLTGALMRWEEIDIAYDEIELGKAYCDRDEVKL